MLISPRLAKIKESLNRNNELEGMSNDHLLVNEVNDVSKLLLISPNYEIKENDINIRSPINKSQASEEDLYEDNAGTALSIIIDNKIIVASDTRHNGSYNINSKQYSKIQKLGNFVITLSGYQADGDELAEKMDNMIRRYEIFRPLTIHSCARLIGATLYRSRFFPLYSYCTLSGFDQGKAFIYSYDPVGSYDTVACNVTGSGTKHIQPLFDSWVDGKNFEEFQPVSFEGAYNLVKMAFDSACESDVKTGDYLDIWVLEDNQPIDKKMFDLRKD